MNGQIVSLCFIIFRYFWHKNAKNKNYVNQKEAYPVIVIKNIL